MKRTISAEVGKGSVNHNSRKFRAENVDGSRTHLNIDYCNERIQTVYHQLFDEALKRYNEKQTSSHQHPPEEQMVHSSGTLDAEPWQSTPVGTVSHL